MNTVNTDKLRELMKEHGFLPDNDLLDFGEIIVDECLSIIKQSASVPNKSEVATVEATRIHHKIADRFGFV